METSAAKALCSLSRPIQESVEEDDTVMVNDAAEDNNEEDGGGATGGYSKLADPEKRKANILEKFNQDYDSPVDAKDIGVAIPANGPWRIGKPTTGKKLSQCPALFMRFATNDDIMPSGGGYQSKQEL